MVRQKRLCFKLNWRILQIIKNYFDMDQTKKWTVIGLVCFICLVCCSAAYVIAQQVSDEPSQQSVNKVDTQVKSSLVWRIHEASNGHRDDIKRSILLEDGTVFVRHSILSRVPSKDGFHFAEKGDTVFYRGNHIIRIGLKHD